MSISITTVKSELASVLHGTSLNKIQNINGIFNRASRQILQEIDPAETKKTLPLGTIYNSVYDYPVPVDLKGNKVIDLKPQTPDRKGIIYSQLFNQRFDVNKQKRSSNFTIEHNNFNRTMRINDIVAPTPTILNYATGVTSNGTWSGTAINLKDDNLNYVYQSSLMFDLPATPTAFVENSTMLPLDVSSLVNQGSLFMYVYLPTASAVTSIDLSWGSDSSNYFTASTNKTQENTTFQDGWNLIAFNWLGSVQTGTPISTAIDYLKINFNYNSQIQTGVRINIISASLGQILECQYYSKYFFRDGITGAFKETTTLDTDLINLDTENANIFFYLVASFAVQQALGQDAPFDISYFEGKYNAAIAKYKMTYKSEFQQVIQPYYITQKPTQNRFVVSGGYNRQ